MNPIRGFFGRWPKTIAFVAFAAVIVVALVVLGGGGGRKASSSQAGTPVNVVWGTITNANFNAGEGAALKRCAAAGKASGAYTVTIMKLPFESYDATMTTRLRAGQGPDLGRVDHTMVGQWESSNFLAPLDSYVAHSKAAAQSRFIPALWAEGNRDGHQYVVPYTTDARALYWSPRLFKKAGIVDASGKPVAPVTWAQLKADALKLKSHGVYGYGFATDNDYSVAYEAAGGYMFTNGGHILSTSNGRLTASSSNPQTVQAVQLLADLVHAGVTPPNESHLTSDDIAALAAQSKLAMFMGGPWMKGFMAKTNKHMKYGVDFAVAPTPLRTEGQNPASIAGGWRLGIFTKDAKKAAASFKLMECMLGTANLGTISLTEGFPPTTTGLGEKPWSNDPFYAAFRVVLPHSSQPLPGAPNVAELLKTFETDVLPAALGQTPPASALQKFDTTANGSILR
jgi:multiple sugar transport system substrate-binding protein